MLSYLHVCVEAGVVVVDYRDEATGAMRTDAEGGGRFTSVVLHPEVTVADDPRVAAQPCSRNSAPVGSRSTASRP